VQNRGPGPKSEVPESVRLMELDAGTWKTGGCVLELLKWELAAFGGVSTMACWSIQAMQPLMSGARWQAVL
jgi:hypothetical protein